MNKLLPILLVVVMCGCATITGGGKQSLTITSYYKNTNNELIEMNGAKCSLENSNTQLNVETPNKGLSIPLLSHAYLKIKSIALAKWRFFLIDWIL